MCHRLGLRNEARAEMQTVGIGSKKENRRSPKLMVRNLTSILCPSPESNTAY